MKLRHVSGKDLKKLEEALSLIKRPFSILNVTNVDGVWRVHYVLHGMTQPDPQAIGVYNSNFESTMAVKSPEVLSGT